MNQAINHNLETLAKQLYDYWFVQFDFPDENGKPYKSSGGKMVWNEKLKKHIPQNWEYKMLKDIASTSKLLCTPKNGVLYKHYSIPAFDQCGSFSIEDGCDIHSDKFVVADNNLLVSKLNPWFNRVIWVEEKDAICSTEFVVLCQNNENIRAFLFSMVKTNTFIDYCSRASTGTSHSQRRVSPDVVWSYGFPYNQSVVESYGKIVFNCIKTIVSNQNEIRNLAKQRDELLPLLMNGQATIKQQ